MKRSPKWPERGFAYPVRIDVGHWRDDDPTITCNIIIDQIIDENGVRGDAFHCLDCRTRGPLRAGARRTYIDARKHSVLCTERGRAAAEIAELQQVSDSHENFAAQQRLLAECKP